MGMEEVVLFVTKGTWNYVLDGVEWSRGETRAERVVVVGPGGSEVIRHRAKRTPHCASFLSFCNTLIHVTHGVDDIVRDDHSTFEFMNLSFMFSNVKHMSYRGPSSTGHEDRSLRTILQQTLPSAKRSSDPPRRITSTHHHPRRDF